MTESEFHSTPRDLQSTLDDDHLFKSGAAASRLEADADEKKVAAIIKRGKALKDVNSPPNMPQQTL